jgi:hypothetical protein
VVARTTREEISGGNIVCSLTVLDNFFHVCLHKIREPSTYRSRKQTDSGNTVLKVSGSRSLVFFSDPDPHFVTARDPVLKYFFYG